MNGMASFTTRKPNQMGAETVKEPSLLRGAGFPTPNEVI